MEARQVAFHALLKVKTEGAYSNQALTKLFLEHDLSAKDKGLATEITYGTLTHYTALHFWLEPYFQGRVKEWVRILLAMTLYQIVYLKKIPDYAAIAEAVEIAKTRGGNFNANTVNAILRNITKAKALRSFNDIEDPFKRLATQHSHPEWLLRLWVSQFGDADTQAMLKANNVAPEMVLRVNAVLTDRKTLMDELRKEGATCRAGSLSDGAIIVAAGNPLRSIAFKKGHFYVQDEASMLPALALKPAEGARVLDVCAAPGGKTFQLSEMVADGGVVYAHDIFDHKIARIKENMKRLKVDNVKASLCSALELEKLHEFESFDYILVDAPCSGLGILRRHPEAKMTKTPEDIDEIVQIQKDILAHAARFLKPGGRLVYSTCTVNRKENHRQVDAFLKNFPQFEKDADFEARMPKALENCFEDGMLQLMPHHFQTDGFFVASLVKKTSVGEL